MDWQARPDGHGLGCRYRGSPCGSSLALPVHLNNQHAARCVRYDVGCHAAHDELGDTAPPM